jgi:hypothetical protein
VPASALSPRRRIIRRWRKQTGFSGGALTHELLIHEGPDGRPGERLLTTSQSLHPPRVGSDGSRKDFRVLLDRHGSTLAAVCLHPVGAPADVEEEAWRTLRHVLDLGAEGTYDVTPDRVAEERAYRYSVVLRSGVLTEWKLAHGGWLYVVGTLSWAPPEEREITDRRTLEVLRTWKWLDIEASRPAMRRDALP